MSTEEEQRKTREPQEELWVTLDGIAINVGEMEEEHARNTLRMLIKQIAKGDLNRLGYHQSRIIRARAGLPPDLERLDWSWPESEK